MSLEIDYQITTMDSPFWSFTIHDGHSISEELMPYVKLSDAERLREEDPYTASIADLPINQFIVSTSRFQLDLNRNLDNALYLRPEQAWGLEVFQPTLPESYVTQLHKQHQVLYNSIERHIASTIKKYGYFVILDIHSYNAKRESAEEIVDETKNPQINLGTFYNTAKWDKFIQHFAQIMKEAGSTVGENLDIRENVKFKGGNLAQHLIQRYGDLGCVISIEFRKDFMDEWSGEVYKDKVVAYNKILKDTVSAMYNYFQTNK